MIDEKRAAELKDDLDRVQAEAYGDSQEHIRLLVQVVREILDEVTIPAEFVQTIPSDQLMAFLREQQAKRTQ